MAPSQLPRPLIGVDELAAAIDDPRLRICDVRWKLGAPDHGPAVFAAGHLPGAIFVDLDRDLSDLAGLGAPGRHPLPDPEAFARRMAELGIGDDSFVVAYDDAGGTVAARLWWMLDNLGHASSAVLDGGIDAWRAAGLPLSTEPARHALAELHLAPDWTSTIEREALRSRLDSVVLLDARTPERYRGETEPVDPVPGHIPTAHNAPTSINLEAGRFLPGAALAERYRGLVEAEGRDVVVSCGSGVNACHTALALRVAGLPDAILYPGSYSDWSRTGWPVVAGQEPGQSSAARSKT